MTWRLAVGVPAGVPIAFYRDDGTSTGERLGAATTTRPLLPGESEFVEFVWRAPPATLELPSAIWVVDDDDRIGECDESNNLARRENVSCSPLE